MIRRLLLLASIGCFVVGGAVPAHADADGDDLHKTGLTRARSLARWALGEGPSPLLMAFEGDCGDRVGNAFFLAPPIGQDMELRCRVPLDTAIVFSHAAWFTTIPADGSTDAQIIAAANAGFDPVSSWVTFDGERVGLSGKTFNLGAFTVWSEKGSFYDEIGLGTGGVRTSLTGTIMTLPPQDECGRHVIKTAVDFGVPDEVFSVTYRIRIGGCDD